MMAAVTALDAGVFAAGIILFEVGLWYAAKALWAVGLWKNNRNIRKRREAWERAVQESE